LQEDSIKVEVVYFLGIKLRVFKLNLLWI